MMPAEARRAKPLTANDASAPATPARTLIGCTLIAGVLGSLHAFSVLLTPFEQLFGSNRSSASLIYSAAIVCLTLSVLFAHRVQAAWHPSIIALGVGVLASAGLLLAAWTTRLGVALIGYGLLFGGANGAGYSLALAQAAAAWPARKGFATGTVTAAYAGGAMISASLMQPAVERHGVAITLATLAAVVLAGATISAMFQAREFRRIASTDAAAAGASEPTTLVLLWLGYLFGATAGLMSIGHAAGIVAAKGGTAAAVAAGAMVIAFGNGLGSLLSGWLTDRMPIARVLVSISVFAALAYLLAAFCADATFAVPTLGAIGFAYGAQIAVYPVAAHRFFGAAGAARVFGRIFTAWGIAGLTGPWIGGMLFDQSGDYDFALTIAAVIAAAGILPAMLLRSTSPTQATLV